VSFGFVAPLPQPATSSDASAASEAIASATFRGDRFRSGRGRSIMPGSSDEISVN
jgi:hypothetical protein